MTDMQSIHMPQYRCHKKVWALKIDTVESFTSDETDAAYAQLTFVDKRYGVIVVNETYLNRHKPHAGGYFVVYEDGYWSFSPAIAFEGGYTLIDQEVEPARKTLHNSDISGARMNVRDIKVVGNGDMFSLLCKASSEAEGWMKSTKAMEIPGEGCLVQVTTQQRNPDGSYALAEALSFVPAVQLVADVNNGRKLTSF